MHRFHAALLAALLLAAPAGASSFAIFESSLGAPGVTAQFPHGSGLIADLDFDADSAEGGGLLFGGASEMSFVPTGDLIFVAFSCQLSGCTENADYVFTPGGAGTGSLVVSDPNFGAQTGIVDLGLLEFDIAASFGTIELTGCNYTDGNGVERTCDPFTVAQVPEPGTAALVALGAVALGWSQRRRS